MHCKGYATAQWVHVQGICPIFFSSLVLECIGIRQLGSLTGIEPAWTWTQCCRKLPFRMSRSSSEKTTEKSRSNCSNFAWQLSFGTGVAWSRTLSRPYLWLRSSFASVQWLHCSGLTYGFPGLCMILVLNLYRTFDILGYWRYVLEWHLLEVQKGCWKPRYFVCLRKIVKF